MPKAQRPDQKTVVDVTIAIRRGGTILHEYTCELGSERVQLVTYWPNGRIQAHTTVSLDHFIELLHQARSEAVDREAAPT